MKDREPERKHREKDYKLRPGYSRDYSKIMSDKVYSGMPPNHEFASPIYPPAIPPPLPQAAYHAYVHPPPPPLPPAPMPSHPSAYPEYGHGSNSSVWPSTDSWKSIPPVVASKEKSWDDVQDSWDDCAHTWDDKSKVETVYDHKPSWSESKGLKNEKKYVRSDFKMPRNDDSECWDEDKTQHSNVSRTPNWDDELNDVPVNISPEKKLSPKIKIEKEKEPEPKLTIDDDDHPNVDLEDKKRR